MSSIIKFPICHFKGHVVNPLESIVGDIMIDKRNWLCKCHRCGMYLMHDGAISGYTLCMSKREAYAIKADFEKEFARCKKEVKK